MEQYIKKHWAGEFSLNKSYWLNSIIVANIALFFATFVVGIFYGIMTGAAAISDGKIPVGLDILTLIIMAPIYTWSWVGTWRSASNYAAECKNTLNWGTISQFFIVIGFLNYMTQVAVILKK